MLIEVGQKVHINYRILFENAIRRHFVGEVVAVVGVTCQLKGYVFIYDKRSTVFMRKPEIRTTIINLADAGYIVNMINSNVILENVAYRYLQGSGLVATDDKNFSLNINEFSTKS